MRKDGKIIAMAKVENYIFVDEAGDPGPLFTIDSVTNKKEETGASSFYIITALCVSVEKLYLLEHRMMEVKNTFGYKKEIKSNEISLPLYKNLLDVVNELDIKTYFRLIDKSIYQGAFKVHGKPILHNVFDEFNVVRAVAFAIRDCDIRNVDSFNAYLEKKVSKLCDGDNHRVSHVTHVNSEYVNAMQMSDIISGAIRDDFTKKNKELMKVIASERLILATGKYDRKIRKTKGGV